MSLSHRLLTLLTQGHDRDHEILRKDTRVTGGTLLLPAAVLVAITDRPEPGVILTQRASHLRKHAGQVAFPGGRIDPEDSDAIAAALREAQEEIALPPEHVNVVGVSDAYKSFTGFDIIPVLAVIPPDLPLIAHEHEVEAVFEVPLDYVLSPANRARKAIDFQGQIRHYHEIWWGDHRIWGVTAAIIVNLSKRLGYDDGSA